MFDDHFTLECDSVILKRLDAFNDSLASTRLEIVETCLNLINIGLEHVNFTLDVCLSVLNVGDFHLDVCRVALKLVQTILQRPSLAFVRAKGTLKSVNLPLDIINVLRQVVLRVSDTCDIGLKIGSFLLKLVYVDPDGHSVILQIRQTAIKLLSLIASIAVKTFESV